MVVGLVLGGWVLHGHLVVGIWFGEFLMIN